MMPDLVWVEAMNISFDHFLGSAFLQAHFEDRLFNAYFSLRKAISDAYENVIESRLYVAFSPISKRYKTWASLKISKRPQ